MEIAIRGCISDRRALKIKQPAKHLALLTDVLLHRLASKVLSSFRHEDVNIITANPLWSYSANRNAQITDRLGHKTRLKMLRNHEVGQVIRHISLMCYFNLCKYHKNCEISPTLPDCEANDV